MTEQVNNEIHRITSRHIAKCLTQLEGVRMPLIVIETVKRELWYLSNDLRPLINQNKSTKGVINGC